MASELKMPTLGEGMTEGTVSRWLKQPGDNVSKYEPLLEVSTDKVDTEISSPADGVLLNIQVSEGKTVNVGTLLAVIGQPQEDDRRWTMDDGKTTKDERRKTEDGGQEDDGLKDDGRQTMDDGQAVSNGNGARASQPAEHPEKGRGASRISPVVSRIAAENNVRVEDVQGTGNEGRVTKQDILKYLEMRKQTMGDGGRRTEDAGKAEEATKQGLQQTGEGPTKQEQELAPWEQPGDGDLFHPSAPTRPQKPMQFGPPAASTASPKPQPAPVLTRPSTPVAQPQPVEPALSADETAIELTPMRRAIAEHMVRSVSTSPHVTTVMEADLSKMLAHWQTHKDALAAEGIRLTYTPYFVSATVAGLKAVPQANSTWREGKIVLKHRIHIGIAVALQDGLIVPVIQNADEKNLRGLARAVNDLAERARSKRLQPQEVQGGTFSITNHGVSGSLVATPIINQPQAGILGVGAISKRAVVVNDAIAIRPMCYLSFTFDHRILDGAEADRFLATIKTTLENWAGS